LLELLLVQLGIAGVVLPLYCPEGAADRLLAGPVGRNGVGYRASFGLVERSVGVQVLQPQAPQRLVPRSGPDGGLGVVRCSRAVGATGLRLLASHTLTSTRRKLIGGLQLPTGDAQPDRRVALHTHRNVAYRSDVTNHRKWTLWRLLSILQESVADDRLGQHVADADAAKLLIVRLA
jgi:hypothetical protein